jgi:hypothetical protein
LPIVEDVDRRLVETFADQTPRRSSPLSIGTPRTVLRLLDTLRQRTDALDRSVGELRALGEVSQAGELDTRSGNGPVNDRY